jgi:hypothetical protein
MQASPRLIVMIVTGALILSGCARAEQGTPTAGSAVVASGPVVASSIDPAHPRQGPATATVGKPYPFDLYIHCGGEFTTFAGRTWRTEDPPGNLLPRPDSAGTTRVTGYVAGTMTLMAPDLAHFEVDAAGVVRAPEGPVVFRPTDEQPPLCK